MINDRATIGDQDKRKDNSVNGTGTTHTIYYDYSYVMINS